MRKKLIAALAAAGFTVAGLGLSMSAAGATPPPCSGNVRIAGDDIAIVPQVVFVHEQTTNSCV